MAGSEERFKRDYGGILEHLRRAARGDEQAASDFAERIRPRLVTLAHSAGVPSSRLDDVVQDSLLRVVSHLAPEKTRDESAFNTWLATIVRHRVFDVGKKEARNVAVDPVVLEQQASERPGHDFTQDLADREAAREQAALLGEHVSRLSDGLRKVLDLRTSGLSYPKIAETLGVPLGTVKSRLHYARKYVASGRVPAGEMDEETAQGYVRQAFDELGPQGLTRTFLGAPSRLGIRTSRACSSGVTVLVNVCLAGGLRLWIQCFTAIRTRKCGSCVTMPTLPVLLPGYGPTGR